MRKKWPNVNFSLRLASRAPLICSQLIKTPQNSTILINLIRHHTLKLFGNRHQSRLNLNLAPRKNSFIRKKKKIESIKQICTEKKALQNINKTKGISFNLADDQKDVSLLVSTHYNLIFFFMTNRFKNPECGFLLNSNAIKIFIWQMLLNTSQVGSSCIAIRPEMPFIMQLPCILHLNHRFNLVMFSRIFKMGKR